MDMPFEKASVKQTMDTHGANDAGASDESRKSWLAMRRSNDAEQIKVTNEVMAWLSALPLEVRPRELAIHFPRIFNKLAQLWSSPLLCEKYLNELLLDDRGTRQGFPHGVTGELKTLKSFFVATAKIQHGGVRDTRAAE